MHAMVLVAPAASLAGFRLKRGGRDSRKTAGRSPSREPRCSNLKVRQPMTIVAEPESNTQEQVFAFMMGLTTNPPVRRVDTHAASVFLAGRRAFKIKRSVRFPFLDYSTLAKRKAACEAEMTVNHPFAPQIYHRVASITRGEDGSLSIDGSGIPVEYAVEMERFDERQTIDHLAEAGPPDPELVDDIAEVIAVSHAKTTPAPTEPWVESIPSLIAGNTAAFRTADGICREAIDALEAASRSAFLRIRAVLERRCKQGFLRHCHGDLHLGNIVLIEHKPVLFDAIEFDPAMASIDVLYDLAFPIMEFLHYQRRAAANLLLNRYLTMTPEENLNGLVALPLFLSVRAAIRAKVLHDRLAQNRVDKAAVAETARAYFELACQLITPPAPQLVAVGGLSGSGKSVLARALASTVEPLPGAVVLRSDVARKRLFQVREAHRLPANAYQPEVTKRVYEVLARQAGQVLSQGQSVVVDAVFAHPSERTAIHEVARARNVPFTGLFLVADLATRMMRVGQRKGDASDATPEIAELQQGYDVGTVDWARIDASGPPEQTLESSRAELVHCRLPGPG
jgi:aminoglycoside phosphotransferase family enzyme/predicted kinase